MRLEYFQLIDRVTDLNLSDRTIRTENTVPSASTVFEGHFPGYPLMPGVQLVETMAQTSGWLVIALLKFERMPFLASVKEGKMRDFVRPGEPLTVDAHVVHDGSGFAVTDAKISVDGKVKCNAILTFRHTPFPNADLRSHMQQMAQQIGFPAQAMS